MNIEKILLISIIIYLIISHNKINNKEHFAVTDDIRAAVKEVYNTDMEAVRKLDKMAQDLTTGALKVPGNLTVTGTISGVGVVPIGSIIMWSGTIGTIPSNYTLCNGGNGTPDLRDKFVIGATQDMYNASSGNVWKAQTNITGTQTMTGGTKDAIVVSHNHAVTDPGHTHDQHNGQDYNWKDGTGGIAASRMSSGNYGGTIIKSNTTGITIDSKGDSGTNQNLPPYYALAFIMRIS
jgi:hypothetical protein